MYSICKFYHFDKVFLHKVTLNLFSQVSQASKEYRVPAQLARSDFQATKEIKEEQDSQVFACVSVEKCVCVATHIQ